MTWLPGQVLQEGAYVITRVLSSRCALARPAGVAGKIRGPGWLRIERLGPSDQIEAQAREDLSLRLQSLSHPALARQYGLVVEGEELLLVRDWIPGLGLDRLLQLVVTRLTPVEVLPWLRRLAQVGQMLHDRPVPWSFLPLEPCQLVVTPRGSLVLADLRPLQTGLPGEDGQDLKAVGRLACLLLTGSGKAPAARGSGLTTAWRRLLVGMLGLDLPMQDFPELLEGLAALSPAPSLPESKPWDPWSDPWGPFQALGRLASGRPPRAAVLLLAAGLVASLWHHGAAAPPARVGPTLVVACQQRLALVSLQDQSCYGLIDMGAEVDAVAADPVGGLLVCLADRSLVRLDPDRYRELSHQRLPNRLHQLSLAGPNRAAAFDPQGGWVAALSREGSGWVGSWLQMPGVTDLAVDPERAYLAVPGAGHLTTLHLDPASPALGPPLDASRLAMSEDGQELAVATRDGEVSVLGPESHVQRLGGAGPGPRALAFSGHQRVWVGQDRPWVVGLSLGGEPPASWPISGKASQIVVEPTLERALWIAVQGQSQLVRLDPQTGQTEWVALPGVAGELALLP